MDDEKIFANVNLQIKILFSKVFIIIHCFSWHTFPEVKKSFWIGRECLTQSLMRKKVYILLKLCHRATETSCKKQKLARQISCEKLAIMNSTNYDEKKSMAQNAYNCLLRKGFLKM